MNFSLINLEALLPQVFGAGAVAVALALAVSTLVSEDLTCIGAGVLVAQGRISFALAAMGCLLGIFVGDLLLFLAGRFLGRPALRRAPLRFFIKPADVEKSSEWFSRKGVAVILLSRFLPGTRLPTYFAAGLLKTSFWKFSLYFFIAAALWTPLLVGLSAKLGAETLNSTLLIGQSVIIKALVSMIVAFVAVKLLVQLSSSRGRRLLVSRWRRMMRWEFWPPWAFYPPVLCYIAFLAIRHRSLTLFTCANPAIPGGGFIGESKIEILRHLSASEQAGARVARALCLAANSNLDTRLAMAREFMLKLDLSFPVVLKPDVGQRGSGVAIVKSESAMEQYLESVQGDTIIQEYVPGCEFGVFYYRSPAEEQGHIFSITEKRFPVVTGDGASTLEQLILADERAVCMARAYFAQHRDQLQRIPASGEAVALVELGTHCRGAVFLDGIHFKTAEIEAAIDQLSRGFKGFYFGRFDLRAASPADFMNGENFKVVELNGVTSEATHIYDPRNSLLTAYRILFEQWRIAFEIGAQNRARGASPMQLRALARLLIANMGKGTSTPDSDQASNDGNISCPSGDLTIVKEL